MTAARTHPSSSTPRFPEIDLLRGIAAGCMILFHAAFDLAFFGGQQWELNNGIIWLIGRSAAVLFVALAGVSMGLAWKRKHGEKTRPLLLRGIQIIGMGMVLTTFTWIFFPTYTIWFGVLHLIGAGILIGTCLLPYPRATLFAGIIGTIGGITLSIIPTTIEALAIIPLFPAAFQTFDYFPLLPWMGVFFLGMSAGNYFFPSGRQRYQVSFDTQHPIARALIWAGRNSLLLYFVHQPILVGIIMLLRIA